MRQEKQKEDVCRVVLLAVQQHPKQMGVDALALVLKGSRSKRIEMRRLHESRFFGSLFYYTTEVIENFVKQCLQLGFLATVNMGVSVYPTPVLVLTETGKKLLETKEIVTIAVIKNEKEKELRLTPAVEEACRLMKELRSVDEVAKRKRLAVSTIYDYLSKGIELGAIEVDSVVSKEVQQQIKAAIGSGVERVKEIKEKLPESVGYGEVRCVLADIKRRKLKNENGENRLRTGLLA